MLTTGLSGRFQLTRVGIFSLAEDAGKCGLAEIGAGEHPPTPSSEIVTANSGLLDHRETLIVLLKCGYHQTPQLYVDRHRGAPRTVRGTR